MPVGVAHAYELGCGVSVVAIDSSPIRKPDVWSLWSPDMQAVVDALRSARGPWRILIAHHPVVAIKLDEPKPEARRRKYAERLAEAIEESGVDVQLMISGHEHYLAASPEPGGAFLNLVAGSGSSARSQPPPAREVSFRASELGFAQVSLLREGEDSVLRASLWGMGRSGGSMSRRLGDRC